MDDSIHVRFTFNSNNTNGIDPKTGKFKTGVMQNKKGEKYIMKSKKGSKFS